MPAKARGLWCLTIANFSKYQISVASANGHKGHAGPGVKRGIRRAGSAPDERQANAVAWPNLLLLPKIYESLGTGLA